MNTTPDVAVLITNVGSPSAPTPSAVRSYLRQFLSDPLVIDAPRLRWWLIRNLFVLPFRAPRSARLYRSIWTDQGSPLISTTRRQAGALSERLERLLGSPIPVVAGMRYGSPSLDAALDAIGELGRRRVLVLPLFPQYSHTTVKTTRDALARAAGRRHRPPETKVVNGYATHPPYIRALAESVRAEWTARGSGDHLLLSFHGLPQRYADAGDPYPQDCRRTAEALAGELGLDASAWTLSYQSRFGREEWLRPSTEETLRQLGGRGQSALDVICPGFAADCLETLEEIAVTNRRTYEDSGGSGFRYIPALNDRPAHIDALAALVVDELRDWR
jgi:ferrochelatase